MFLSRFISLVSAIFFIPKSIAGDRKLLEPVEMASLGFNLGFSFSGVKIHQHRQVSATGRARVISCCSSSSSEASQQGISATTPPPEIELEFFGVTIGAIFSLSYDPILSFENSLLVFVICSRSLGAMGRIRGIKRKL